MDIGFRVLTQRAFIDCFKQYNDHYGHIQGDDCLRRVAQALLDVSTRSRDFLGRFGGEEFIPILPETDAPSAAKVAERCRRLILDLRIPHVRSDIGQTVTVTVSVGVATMAPADSVEPVQFIELVDRRLYQAKQSGRNRIVGSGESRAEIAAGKSAVA